MTILPRLEYILIIINTILEGDASGESWKSFREELHQFSLLPSQTSFSPPFETLSKHCHDGFTAPLDQQEEALYRISSPHLCYPLTCAG